jgi:hypothetical protein
VQIPIYVHNIYLYLFSQVLFYDLFTKKDVLNDATCGHSIFFTVAGKAHIRNDISTIFDNKNVIANDKSHLRRSCICVALVLK